MCVSFKGQTLKYLVTALQMRKKIDSECVNERKRKPKMSTIEFHKKKTKEKEEEGKLPIQIQVYVVLTG